MDFALSDEQRAIRDTARDFIAREVMPLEQELLRRERAHRPGLERSELRDLQLKARTVGFSIFTMRERSIGVPTTTASQSTLLIVCSRSSSCWAP